MTFGKAEIDDENSALFTTEYKVAGLDVSVNKSALMHLPDRSEHLSEDLNH